MTFPPCDVIIPARDAARTIANAMTSVLAQTAPDLRLFVVDDGSRDDTARIVQRFAASDARVSLISQSGGGISAAMNAGLAAGQSPFVARLDADDISHPMRHACQLAHLVANPGTVAVSGAHEEIRADGTLTGRIHSPAFVTQADPSFAPAVEPALTQPFFMVRRTAITQAGGYRPFPVSEDSDLYWRLAERGTLVSLPDVLGSYRLHADSISSASIINGRLMAVCSQLAALSARRRADMKADLRIPARPLWREKVGIADMLDQAATDTGVMEDERAWLRVAVAAKLMELAGYRPYEITVADCRFIAQAIENDAGGLSPDNRAELAKMRTATAARLLRSGHFKSAMILGRTSRLPQTLLRAATGRLYWTKHPG